MSQRHRDHTTMKLLALARVRGGVRDPIQGSRQEVGCHSNMIAKRVDDAREEVAGEAMSPK